MPVPHCSSLWRSTTTPVSSTISPPIAGLGGVQEFGQSANSRVTVFLPSLTTTATLVWGVSSIRDVMGTAHTYTYQPVSSDDAVLYPQRIDYSENLSRM